MGIGDAHQARQRVHLPQTGRQFKCSLAGFGRVQQAKVHVGAELVFKGIHGMEHIHVLPQLRHDSPDLVNQRGLVADQQHT